MKQNYILFYTYRKQVENRYVYTLILPEKYTFHTS